MRKGLNNIQITGISFEIIAFILMEVLIIINKEIPDIIMILFGSGVLVAFIGNFLPKKQINDKSDRILTVRKKMYINVAASSAILIFYIILNIKDDVMKRSVGFWFVGCVILLSILVHTVLSISNKEILNEISFMNLKRTDSICMKILCCFFITLIVLIAFSKLTMVQLGYLIGIFLMIINILRVCIFTIMEHECKI